MNHAWEALLMNQELTGWQEVKQELSAGGRGYLAAVVIIVMSLPFLQYVA